MELWCNAFEEIKGKQGLSLTSGWIHLSLLHNICSTLRAMTTPWPVQEHNTSQPGARDGRGTLGRIPSSPILLPSRIQIAGNLLDQKTFFNLQLANQSGAICKCPRGRELQVQQRVREIRVQIRRGSASRGVERERAVDRCWGAPSHAATGPAPRHKNWSPAGRRRCPPRRRRRYTRDHPSIRTPSPKIH